MSELNNSMVTSSVRSPRGQVWANGMPTSGMVEFSVDNNSYQQADTFRCVLVISAQPHGYGIDWWLNQDQIEVELLAGFPANPESYSRTELKSLLIGYVDDIEIDPIGGTIVMTGRDHTGKLIDTTSSLAVVTGPNSIRSSNIVTMIAKKAGLNPVVTPTPWASPGGTYYNLVKQIVESRGNYWNLVCRLAQVEQFVAYVSGNDLHFEPRTIADDDYYVIKWAAPSGQDGFPTSNTQRLHFSRNLFVAKDIKVTVLAHDIMSDRPVKASAQKTRVRNKVTAGAGSSSVPPVEYIYHFGHMKHSDAQAKANEILLQLSHHEMNLHAELQADSILTSRTLIKVDGTGTRADQTYYPASIVRTFSLDAGYHMELTAKNISPDVQIGQS